MILEKIQELWPVLNGSHGLFPALLGWRGFIGVAVPLFNTWLQMKFTELLKASPTIANDIVKQSWYKTISLFLRMVAGIMLPTEASMLLHQVNENIKNDSNPVAFKKSVVDTTNPKGE